MFKISNHVYIALSEMDMTAIRAQGAGGQNVNKVSTAIHLRFDIKKSSLPDAYKLKLLQFQDDRITSDGIIIIKAQRYRSQELNREDAIHRLLSLIGKAVAVHKIRNPTQPGKLSIRKRLDRKTQHGQLKKLRNKGSIDE